MNSPQLTSAGFTGFVFLYALIAIVQLLGLVMGLTDFGAEDKTFFIASIINFLYPVAALIMLFYKERRGQFNSVRPKTALAVTGGVLIIVLASPVFFANSGCHDLGCAFAFLFGLLAVFQAIIAIFLLGFMYKRYQWSAPVFLMWSLALIGSATIMPLLAILGI